MANPFANLVLNTRTYVPSSYAQGVAGWTYQGTAGVPGEFSLLSQRFYKANGKDGAYHTVHKLTVPVVAGASSACACEGDVLRTSGFDINMFAAPSSTAAERLDTYERLKSLVATDAFKKAFTELTPVISVT